MQKKIELDFQNCPDLEFYDDEEEDDGGDSEMPAPGSRTYLTKDDIYYLSAIGLIEIDTKRPEEVFEFSHDRPGTEIWGFLNRKYRKRKRILVGDDGRVRFDDLLVAPWIDWESKLSIHDPGCVDPLPMP